MNNTNVLHDNPIEARAHIELVLASFGLPSKGHKEDAVEAFISSYGSSLEACKKFGIAAFDILFDLCQKKGGGGGLGGTHHSEEEEEEEEEEHDAFGGASIGSSVRGPGGSVVAPIHSGGGVGGVNTTSSMPPVHHNWDQSLCSQEVSTYERIEAGSSTNRHAVAVAPAGRNNNNTRMPPLFAHLQWMGKNNNNNSDSRTDGGGGEEEVGAVPLGGTLVHSPNQQRLAVPPHHTIAGGAGGGLNVSGGISGGILLVSALSNSECGAGASQSLITQTFHVDKSIDEEGNKIINTYTLVADLGRGAYGKVKLAVDEDNCPVAIKIIRKQLLKKLGGDQSLAREIAVMKKLKHRNVVPLYEVIDDPECAKLYLVMKYIDQGPIAKMQADNTCEAIGASRAQEVMSELVSGLSYLHKRGVAHRDIKPDNILMDAAGTPYFADFGVSSIINQDDPSVSTVEGTALFMAPELFSDSKLKVDAFAADVWSLGVTLYLLLYGVAPYRGSNYREIADAVRNGVLRFPDGSEASAGVGETWKDLLRGMLCKDPGKRMTLKQIKKHDAIVGSDAVTNADIAAAMSSVTGFVQGSDADGDPTLLKSMIRVGLTAPTTGRSARKASSLPQVPTYFPPAIPPPPVADRVPVELSSASDPTTTTTTTTTATIGGRGELLVSAEGVECLPFCPPVRMIMTDGEDHMDDALMQMLVTMASHQEQQQQDRSSCAGNVVARTNSGQTAVAFGGVGADVQPTIPAATSENFSSDDVSCSILVPSPPKSIRASFGKRPPQ